METLLGHLSDADPNAITSFFCYLIVGLFLGSLVISFTPLLQRWPPFARIAVISPSLLATLGVLGTFVGILVGLLDFDVDKIDASVPQLLAGLKIAFITSIVGMIASISYRFLSSFAPRRGADNGTSAADIHEVLTEIRNGIASDGDASLVTQVQKLRTSVQDGNENMIREFRQFAEHMTENNQRAVIEALEAVIRDFNTKLNEQFGENFKQLNTAVGKLVEWQEQYRLQMIELAERLDVGTQATERAAKALAEVQQHSEAIPAAVSALSPAMQRLLEETSRLQAQLQAVAELKTNAVEVFPIIEKNLSELGSALQTMSRETNDNFRAHTERMEQELQKELQQAINALGQNLATLSEKFVSDYEPLTTTLQQLVRQVEGVRT